jgi:MFS family permease
MVTGVNATVAGFLMIPMMAGLLVTSIVSGALVSKTGRYKWFPIVGTLIVAAALVLLSTMTPTTPIWLLCSYLAVMGFGLGMGMQILVLIVQNTFPNSLVGTATAGNNFFRQIGASLGSAVVGSLFTSRLIDLLSQRLPGAGSTVHGGINSLTPGVVDKMPSALRVPIISSYNDALVPVFLYMVPLVLVAVVLLCFVREVPLATRIERDVAPVPAGEGEKTERAQAHVEVEPGEAETAAPTGQAVLVGERLADVEPDTAEVPTAER